MTLWDDVKHNMAEWYGTAAEKTNELARVGVRRYDIFGLSRDIERQFVEMGSLVYNALNEGRTDLHEDEVLQGLIARVKELEKELKAKESEIQDIRTAAQSAAAATGESEAEDGEAPADAAETDDDLEVEVFEIEPDPEEEEKS